LFRDTIGSLASTMLTSDSGGVFRVKRYEEYVAEVIDGIPSLKYQPLNRMLKDFAPESKPLVWLRLVAVAEVCRSLVGIQGEPLQLEVACMDLAQALSRAQD